MYDSSLRALIKQYKSAYGIYKFDIKRESDWREFEDWLRELKNRNEIYLSILKDNNIRIPNDFTAAEVFKSKSDMVTGKYQTKIISNYIKSEDSDVFIKGDFKVFNGKPYVFKQDENGITTFENLENIDTFITQNPYSPDYINGWEDLHNNAYNIILGVYGNKHDKDKKDKIKMLSQLEEKLNAHVIDEYTEAFGDYYYFVASDPTKIEKRPHI